MTVPSGTGAPVERGAHESDPVLARRLRLERAAVVLALLFGVVGLIRLYVRSIATEYQLKSDAPARIDLNRDPEETIELLPRVGPKLARRIVLERSANGPYASLPDLARRVPGIGASTAEALKDHVAFSPTPEK